MAGKRKLFEEVGAEGPNQSGRVQRATGVIDEGRQGARGAIRAWLVLLFVLVVVMIAVGGLTRLTDSGLSITEWAPISGALPPLTAEDWQRAFDLYREIPEYQIQNRGMSLEDFKVIYWWEWGHRQLGRVIGLVWVAGFLGFALSGQIPRGRAGLVPLAGALVFAGAAILGAVLESLGVLSAAQGAGMVTGALAGFAVMIAGYLTAPTSDWTARLLFLGILGGLQGAIGWWMVASGLGEGMLDVASYRLATHLGLAFVILGLIAWHVYQLSRDDRDLLLARRFAEPRLFSIATGLMHLAFLQILLGALVAGIDAGRNYFDWPLMAGGFLPPDPLQIEPVWRNFFENDGTVQFMHRMVGYALLLFGIVVWIRGRTSPHRDTRVRFNAVMAMLLVQMVLGVVTVLYMSPWNIAILHQFGAVVLWALILRARFAARYPIQSSLRGT